MALKINVSKGTSFPFSNINIYIVRICNWFTSVTYNFNTKKCAKGGWRCDHQVKVLHFFVKYTEPETPDNWSRKLSGIHQIINSW